MAEIDSNVLIKMSLEAQSIRDFIQMYVQHCRRTDEKFSYAFLSRQCGFKSRSFLREVASGRRSFTRESLYKFFDGVCLAGEARELLLLLYAQEKNDNAATHFALESARARVYSQLQKKTVSPLLKNQIYWRFIYAALSERPSPDSRVARRVGLPLEKTQEILVEMNQQQLILWSPDPKGYYLPERHIIFSELQKDENSFSRFFRFIQMKNYNNEKNFNKPGRLFQNSTVLVDSNRLPELKAELRRLLTRFVDDIETAEGDCVLNINLSMLKSSDLLSIGELEKSNPP